MFDGAAPGFRQAFDHGGDVVSLEFGQGHHLPATGTAAGPAGDRPVPVDKGFYRGIDELVIDLLQRRQHAERRDLVRGDGELQFQRFAVKRQIDLGGYFLGHILKLVC
ncbi:hypothetical protein [Methylomonas koyamae]|uniref:hypothetical protein n=1 Tax=Methylomonas koyamae TaxID=702114 RepID=UPI0006D225B6|nr:hypothetical protein [Methylomonas koyamae]